MTKYMLFDWGQEYAPRVDEDVPAKRLLGTYHELPEEEEPGHLVPFYNDENEVVEYVESGVGLKLLDLDVTLTDELMLGKTFPMKVYVSYRDQPEDTASMRKLVAYYEVPGNG